MAAVFKNPAPPGHDAAQRERSAVLTLVWRADTDGRLLRRWQAAFW